MGLPKKKYLITTFDFENLPDITLMGLGEKFEKSLDELEQDGIRPKTLKKVVGFFINLHFYTIELRKRFPEEMEKVDNEMVLNKLLRNLKINTDDK